MQDRVAVLVVAWALAVLTVAGCDGCGAKPADKPPPAAPIDRPLAKAIENSSLDGFVHLAAPAVPAFTPDEMERKMLDHAERGPWPQECSPAKLTDRRPMQVTSDGKLTNVIVAASNFSKSPSRPPRVHEVRIVDCRLSPSVIVAMQGDKLEVRNEVQFPFMPAYGPPAPLRTLVPGQTYEVELKELGAQALTCGFTAPCGRTDVIVLSHPLATVTDERGHFRIDSLPGGERVTVSAWHPLLAESKTEVELVPGESKSLELAVTPRLP